MASNGNLYFTLLDPALESEDDIFMCLWKEGAYATPVALSSEINTPGAEYNAYISPEESYLIFGGFNREGSVGRGDMYISYRNEAGNWEPAIQLPVPVNSVATDFCPFVNTATNTLYFTSRRANNFGSTEGIINVETLLERLNQYQNGSSRLYKVDAEMWFNKSKK